MRKLVYLEWVDATSGNGWSPVTGPADRTPAYMLSVGWLLEDTKSWITLTHTMDQSEEQANGFITVPKGWIRKKKVIRV